MRTDKRCYCALARSVVLLVHARVGDQLQVIDNIIEFLEVPPRMCHLQGSVFGVSRVSAHC